MVYVDQGNQPRMPSYYICDGLSKSHKVSYLSSYSKEAEGNDVDLEVELTTL